MRKPASINLKWLIQKHANVKAVWKQQTMCCRTRVRFLGSPGFTTPEQTCTQGERTEPEGKVLTPRGDPGWDLDWHLGGRNNIQEGAGQWAGHKPGQVGLCDPETSWTRGLKQILPRVWECPCRVEAEWPSPAVYIAYWTCLSATRDISMGLDSARVLLKVRKQPKKRSHSIVLIICWRVVKGLCEFCPGEWGSTFQAQHKLVSVTACSSGSGWLLGRWQPYISSIPSAPPTWLQ